MKTIIEMAREAGLCWKPDAETLEEIERFAALVRDDEREACAKVCEEQYQTSMSPWLIDCAAAIRARGE